MGGVFFLIMIQEWTYRPAFKFMGICVICSSVLTLLITTRGHAGIFRGSDAPEVLSRRSGRLRSSADENSSTEQYEQGVTSSTTVVAG